MNSLICVDSVERLARLDPGAVCPLDADTFRQTRPSCHLALLDAGGKLVARCSLWRANDAQGDPTPTGLIGHYAAADADVGRELLRHAVDRHRAEGRERVVGPVDGSTWHHYRFLTERGTEPVFFLEPDNPDDWLRHFTTTGFVPFATYVSVLNTDLSQVDPRSDHRRDELKRNGITIRTVNLERFDCELSAIHELSLAAFARNLLYSPIGLEEFVASYAPIRSHVVPELVLPAERDGHLVGFVFGIPNLMEREQTSSGTNRSRGTHHKRRYQGALGHNNTRITLRCK